MHDNLKELITATSQQVGLSEAVIEKDYHVTRAIGILAQLKNPSFNLIFTGGTCLAKAHQVIARMSEDIDFKLQLTHEGKLLSRTQLNKVIKQFREDMLSVLATQAFTHIGSNVKNEGRNVKVDLDYQSLFHKKATLRPHLQIEFTLSGLHLPTHDLEVTSIIQQTLKDKVQLETCTLPCVDIDETLAEKWVALTRRISGMERDYLRKEHTLIRHLHDITIISTTNKLTKNFYQIAWSTIAQDAEQFKAQHPEYHDSPTEEIKRSLYILETDPTWEKSYTDFIDDMLFDKHSVMSYQEALKILKKLSVKVIRQE